MTDSIDENFPTEGEGGVEDHSTHTSAEIAGTVSAMKTFNSANYNSDMAGKLIDTGVWKRHQGSFEPARNFNHYNQKFMSGSPMSD